MWVIPTDAVVKHRMLERSERKSAPVDHVVGVKVGQALQGAVCYGSYLDFL